MGSQPERVERLAFGRSREGIRCPGISACGRQCTPPQRFLARSRVWDWFRRFRNEPARRSWPSGRSRPIWSDSAAKLRPSRWGMDRRTARTVKSGGPRGRNGAKRIVGRTCHVPVYTDGRLRTAVVGAASVQTSDNVVPIAARSRFWMVRSISMDCEEARGTGSSRRRHDHACCPSRKSAVESPFHDAKPWDLRQPRDAVELRQRYPMVGIRIRPKAWRSTTPNTTGSSLSDPP